MRLNCFQGDRRRRRTRRGGHGASRIAALSRPGAGKWQRAIEDYREALRLQPKLAPRTTTWHGCSPPVPSMHSAMDKRPLSMRPGHATLPAGVTRAAWGRWPRPVPRSATLARPCSWQKRALADPAYRQMHGEATVSGRLRLYEQGLPYRLPIARRLKFCAR